MPTIKFDIGPAVRDIEGLSRASEAFASQVRDIMSQMTQMVSTFGSTAARVAGAPGAGGMVGPGDFLTPVGREQAARDISRAARTRELQAKIETGQVYEQSGRFMSRTASPTGTSFQAHGTVQEHQRNVAWMNAIERSHQQVTAGTATTGTTANTGATMAPPIATSITGGGMNLAGVGYGLGDVPRMMQMRGGLGGQEGKLADAIAGLSRSSDERSRDAALILGAVQRELKKTGEDFTSALREFRNVADRPATDREYLNRLEGLKNAMGTLEGAVRETEAAQRGAAGLPGGGGGGPGGMRGLLGKMSPYAAGIGAAFGAGVAGIGAYQTIGLAQDRAVSMGPLSLAQSQGSLAAMLSQREMERANMMQAENIMRYGAGMLQPGRPSSYLGVGGLDRARAVGGGMVDLQTDIQREERNNAMTRIGLGGIIGGVVGGTLGSIIPGAGTAVGAGAGVIAGGAIAGFMGNAGNMGSTYIESPYTVGGGGLNEGLTGLMGRMRRGAQYTNLADIAQASVLAQRSEQRERLARQLQDAELQANQRPMRAISEELEMYRAQHESASRLGEYASTRQQMMQLLTGYSHPSVAARAGTAAGGSAWPVPGGNVTSPYGARIDPITGQRKFHFGVDIAAPLGSDILSVGAGTVVGVGASIPGGSALGANAIAIQQEDGTRAVYGHNSAALVRMGDQVARGQLIGRVGREGRATGAHLHLSMRGANGQYIDPTSILSGEAGSMASPETTMRAGMTPWAGLGLGAAEFMGYQSQLTEQLGSRLTGFPDVKFGEGFGTTGLVAGAGATARMVGLSRSGLGDYGALMGNLGAINRISGGQDNTGQLERTLAQAVAVGFDKSRTAQQFVQATTSIAQGLNLQNVAATAGALGMAATGLSPGGLLADERSLGAAQRGIMGYASFTGQREGPVGAAKALALAGAGASVGGGFLTAMGMNAMEARDMLSDLNDPSRAGQNQKLQNILRLQGGNRKNTERILRATIEGPGQVIEAQYNILGYGSLSGQIRKMEQQRRAGKLSEGDLSEFRQTTMARMMELGSASGLGPEGAQVAALQMMSDHGLIDERQNKDELLRLKMARGGALATDSARVGLQGYVDNLVADFAHGANSGDFKKKRDEYIAGVKAGAFPLQIGAETAKQYGVQEGAMVTPEALNGGGAMGRAAQAELQKTSTLDIVRRGYAQMAAEGGESRVYVSNFGELVFAMGAVEATKHGAARSNPNTPSNPVMKK